MKNVKMFLAVLMLAFPFAANSALITWTNGKTAGPCVSDCWFADWDGNHGDDTLLGLVRHIDGFGDVVYLSRTEDGTYDGAPSDALLVMFKGGQETLWVFTDASDWDSQFTKDISFVAYFGDGDDLENPSGNGPDPIGVPEPLPLAMLGMGLIGMAAIRRRKTA